MGQERRKRRGAIGGGRLLTSRADEQSRHEPTARREPATLVAVGRERTRRRANSANPRTTQKMVLREITILFALGEVYSFCQNDRKPSTSRRQPSVRHLVTPLDDLSEDTVDDTFFTKASQLAARKRMEELKNGADPIAVALSKCSNPSQRQEESAETEEPQQLVGEEKIPQDPFQLGAWKEIQEMRNRKSSEESGSSESSDDKLILTRTAEGGTTVKREVPQSSGQYHFQKDLLETRLLMEQRSRLRQQNKEIEERIEGWEREMQNLVTIEDEVDNGDSDSPVVGELEEPVNESSSSSGAKLSSDGKELFEPTQEMLDMKQENVEMGLMVLTRGLMAIQSIIDKK